MYKAFKYRIFPTKPQKELIAKHVGSSRFVFNLALETKNAACNIKSFALKNILSGEHRLKSQDELTTLVGVMTLEAQPIASDVGG